jgi:F0F1-type ATP synthase gamma subunit
MTILFFNNFKNSNMGCEICGRNNCCKSFHSLEDQKSFDDVAEIVKDRCREIIRRKVERVNSFYDNHDNVVVILDEVIQAINDADL